MLYQDGAVFVEPLFYGVALGFGAAPFLCPLIYTIDQSGLIN
jgi:hypothetical protein